MRKILSYLWLPITASIAVILLYSSLTIADLKNQNLKLERGQNELQSKIVQLEKEFSSFKTIQVAGIKDEQPKTKKTAPSSESSTAPTPQPIPAPTATITPTATSTPISTSTPTATPTPAPTPIIQATVAIDGVGTYQVEIENDDTAFSILLRAGIENGFSAEYQIYEGMGAFVTCIAGICSHDNYYWAFYYNDNYSMVGASAQSVINGDTTTWKFESF